jgi:hypothetical protein
MCNEIVMGTLGWGEVVGIRLFLKNRNFQFSLAGNLLPFFVASFTPSSFCTKGRADLNTATDRRITPFQAPYYDTKLV